MRNSPYNDDDDEDYDEIIRDLVLAVQEGRNELIHTIFQRPFRTPPPNQQQNNNSSQENYKSNPRGQLYYLTSDLTDRDGCSLLQWAAINNRRHIASYLLSRANTNGNLLLVNYSGGVLQETSLQWALRKKFYAMMDLLYQHGANLGHKSAQGTDALHIACRSG